MTLVPRIWSDTRTFLQVHRPDISNRVSRRVFFNTSNYRNTKLLIEEIDLAGIDSNTKPTHQCDHNNPRKNTKQNVGSLILHTLSQSSSHFGQNKGKKVSPISLYNFMLSIRVTWSLHSKLLYKLIRKIGMKQLFNFSI